MNSKAKKILAGIGLGLVGAMTLTGCTANADINLTQEQFDQLLNKVENYIDNQTQTNQQFQDFMSKEDENNINISDYFNNQNLSEIKETLKDKVNQAAYKVEMGLYDEFYLNSTATVYSGYFIEKDMEGNMNLYFKSDNGIIQSVKNEEYIDYNSSDNNANVVEAQEIDLRNQTYFSYDNGEFDTEYSIDKITSLDIDFDINDANKIYDININEEGVITFKYKTISDVDIGDKLLFHFSEIEYAILNDKIISMKVNIYTSYLEKSIFVFDENSNLIYDEDGYPVLNDSVSQNLHPIVITSDVNQITFSFQYENIDFTEMENTLADLHAQYDSAQ